MLLELLLPLNLLFLLQQKLLPLHHLHLLLLKNLRLRLNYGMGLTVFANNNSVAAYDCMKGLFDDFTGKNKLDTITTQFMDAAACSCSSSWDEVMALCKHYQSITDSRTTAKYLQGYILKHFGVQLDGSKDYLQRIALTGVSE